jgi:hypothetical protein
LVKLHIRQVLPMTPLDFGRRLGIQIEVKEADPAQLLDKRPAVLPPVRHRDEVQRRGELHIDLELLFETGDRP